MERKKLQALKKDLLKQQEIIEDEIQGIEAAGLDESLKESTGELSSYDNFNGDISDITFERAKDIGLRDNVRIIGEKIEYALERMEDGKYGICTICGRKISEERLEALPYATHCIECQSVLDNNLEGTNRRPLEERLFPDSFGHIDNDHDPEEKTIYDGEDTWEELERYGSANSPQDIMGVNDYEDIDEAGEERAGIVDPMDSVTNEEYEETFE